MNGKIVDKSRWTLDDYVIDLFEKKKTDTVEFKAILLIYGRPKIEAIWHKYREHKNKKYPQ